MAAPRSAGSVWRNGSTDCEVLDLASSDSSWASTQEEEGGHQWLAICPHGCLASTPDYKLARWLAAHPSEFCDQH
jgi:hypothetical protein